MEQDELDSQVSTIIPYKMKLWLTVDERNTRAFDGDSGDALRVWMTVLRLVKDENDLGHGVQIKEYLVQSFPIPLAGVWHRLDEFA